MFTCDLGGSLNRLVHLYHYEDYDSRDAARKAAASTPEWRDFVDTSRQHLEQQVGSMHSTAAAHSCHIHQCNTDTAIHTECICIVYPCWRGEHVTLGDPFKVGFLICMQPASTFASCSTACELTLAIPISMPGLILQLQGYTLANTRSIEMRLLVVKNGAARPLQESKILLEAKAVYESIGISSIANFKPAAASTSGQVRTACVCKMWSAGLLVHPGAYWWTLY
jgi:hypothetical protein